MTPQQAYEWLAPKLSIGEREALNVIFRDSERMQYLTDSAATIQYSKRDEETSPHCEVHVARWCRRQTLRDALDVLRSNAPHEGPGAASSRTVPLERRVSRLVNRQKETAMSERYWEAGEVPEVLLDWVNENVVAAIKDYWEDNKPVGWAEIKDGRMVLTVGGPGKPTADDPLGQRDIYALTFDLLAELEEYSAPYADIGVPRSEEQREDMRERAAALRKLADDVAALADRAAEAG
jgi:hypothetical protein